MAEGTGPTNENLTAIYKEMMERTGFYRDGKPTPGVIEVTNLSENNNDLLDKRIKYSSVINPSKLNATAIFELSGSPCIYFTSLAQADPDPHEIAQLRKIAWNHGLAPMLWIITPTKILLYNCYARPSANNEEDARKHLIDIFEQTENGLQKLNDFAGRLQIESGQFWEHEKARQIDRRQRVDESLLADLEEAERQLVKSGLITSIAHALLGRSIFVAYLQDRGILSTEYFQETYNVENFAQLLSTPVAKTATYDGIFEWVHQTFNGDLFPLEYKDEYGHLIRERDIVDDPHLASVGNFLSGMKMQTGQLRLWPYKFDVIPIELISSIYEKFIHSSDSLLAREEGTYYTPINLVDLVLSEVFKRLPTNANILDMSCGSGVFLVESLRRLVACRVANGEEWSRELVRDTLYNQIYGVDINKEAIQIAAFSLYLTALELDPDLQSLDKIKFRSLHEKNLYNADAFDLNASFNEKVPFATKNFHAIVGNPPWRRTQADILANEYRDQHNYPVTRRSLDQVFLWRIADFTNENTVIGLILHSRPFFSHMSDSLEARKQLLTRFRPRVIVNLSALRQEGLFPKTNAPATILIADGSNSNRADTFFLVYAEYTEAFKRHGIIEIGPENVKKVSVQHILSDSDALKIASWGNARDMALIERLRATFPPLRNFVQEPRSVEHRNDEWLGGQGFRGSGSHMVPELYGKKWLPSGKMQPYLIDLDALDLLTERGFDRARDIRIYEAPLVITTRGINEDGFFSAFSADDVVYTEEYYGISFPRQQEYLAHYLNGVLNSYLASYFLFLTASVWGVERDKVEPNDLLRFPLPIPAKGNEYLVARIVESIKKLGLARDKATITESKSQLNNAVFDLYDLSEVERVLVEDTINYTIDFRMKREASKALEPPTDEELITYSSQMIDSIKPFLQTLNEMTLVSDIFETKRAPLQVIKFGLVPVPGRTLPTQVIPGQFLDDILGKIATQLPVKLVDTIYTRRNLRIYSGRDFYIIKPLQRRYWNRSAALSDADTIISEQLKGNYAAVR